MWPTSEQEGILTMKSKTTIRSLAAAASLTAAIAAQAAAAPPVVGGPVSCTLNGNHYDMGVFEGTRKELAAHRKFWSKVFCDNGSYDASQVTHVG